MTLVAQGLNIRFVTEGDIRQMKINVNEHVFEKVWST